MMDLATSSTRMKNDLLASERQLRQKSEASYHELASLLAEIAHRADGERFQELKHSDPGIPDNWSPADWRKFFSGVSFSSWEKVAMRPDAIMLDLKKQIADLQGKLRTADEQLRSERTSKQASGNSDGKKSRSSVASSSASFPVSVESTDGVTTPSLDVLSAYAWAVSAMVPTIAPAEFSDVLTGGSRGSEDRAKAFQRYYSALYLLGNQRLTASMEIEQALKLAFDGKGASSLRRAIEDLFEHFVQADIVSMDEPRTSLKLLRLKPEGQRLYQTVFGHKPFENEWERLVRLRDGDQYPKHALAVVIFALHARKRGYAVQVCPDTGKVNPLIDVVITRDKETLFVAVEADEINRSIEQWKELAALNGGKVAFCSTTLAGRANFIKQCQAGGIRGFSADIESLIVPRYDEITPQSNHPMWQQQW